MRQLTTARFLGTFLDDPAAVPSAVLHALATQLDVSDPTCVGAYRQSEQRWRHTAEIRTAADISPSRQAAFSSVSAAGFAHCAGGGTDRPSALFEHAGSWLVGHKVLLPGVSILERFVSEVRSRMEARLWRRLVRDITSEQRGRLDELLTLVDGSRQSRLDQLRKGPVRASGPALMQALRRIEAVRGLGHDQRLSTHWERWRPRVRRRQCGAHLTLNSGKAPTGLGHQPTSASVSFLAVHLGNAATQGIARGTSLARSWRSRSAFYSYRSQSPRGAPKPFGIN